MAPHVTGVALREFGNAADAPTFARSTANRKPNLSWPTPSPASPPTPEPCVASY